MRASSSLGILITMVPLFEAPVEMLTTSPLSDSSSKVAFCPRRILISPLAKNDSNQPSARETTFETYPISFLISPTV
jgi:hypothetical protein